MEFSLRDLYAGFQIGNDEVFPGYVMGGTIFGHPEHRFLIRCCGTIDHVSAMGDVFRNAPNNEVFADPRRYRIISKPRSVEETLLRFRRAEEIYGTPWWSMHCWQTMAYVVAGNYWWMQE